MSSAFPSAPSARAQGVSPYIRYPVFFGDTVYFVHGHDLCKASAEGCFQTPQGARTLTPLSFASLGKGYFSNLVLSPDGRWIYYSGGAQGDVYRLHTQGGEPEPLTFLQESITPLGFHGPSQLICASSHGLPFQGEPHLFSLDTRQSRPDLCPLSLGPGAFWDQCPITKKIVIQRGGYGYLSWRNYQGGASGRLWVGSPSGGKETPWGEYSFSPLDLGNHNILRPFWSQGRLYFLSDSSGSGNLHSCDSQGGDLRQHTFHKDYYIYESSFGKRGDKDYFLYGCAGNLYGYDVLEDRSWQIPLEEVHRGSEKRLGKTAYENLSDYDVHPQGKRVVLADRGRIFAGSPGKGPALQYGRRDGVRYRLVKWVEDDQWIALKDLGKEEVFQAYQEHQAEPTKEWKEGDFQGKSWGKVLDFLPSPLAQSNLICLTNHRHEIMLVDLEAKVNTLIDRSHKSPVGGFDWSPDGRWIAFSKSSHWGRKICLYSLDTQEITEVTDGQFKDVSPHFDAQGRYLYFLSTRDYSPHWDHLRFQLHFPCQSRVYGVTLQEGKPSPFLLPVLFQGLDKKEQEEGGNKDKETKKEEGVPKGDSPSPVNISLEGIQKRIQEFPVPPRDYSRVGSLGNKVLFLSWGEDEEARGVLHSFDLETLKEDLVATHVSSFSLSRTKQWAAIHTAQGLRVSECQGALPAPDHSVADGGLLRPEKIPLSVDVYQEWPHMFDEAWRLQKEMFWKEDMGDVDWDRVYNRYRALVDRVTTQKDFFHILQQMHGELKTSHAYIFGPREKSKEGLVKSLGIRGCYHEPTQGFQVQCLDEGDVWSASQGTPVYGSGGKIKPGTLILKVNNQPLSREFSFAQALGVYQGEFVYLEISNEGKKEQVMLPGRGPGRYGAYRDWVESNRRYVQEKSQGKVGYIHIPDMGPQGFGEFLRGYLPHYHAPGLLVDVRYNGGGNVSPLILDYLCRKRLGGDQSRWQGEFPYPEESPQGPMAFLANAHTGSDGDIFCHSVKALKLGPLIGKRTWGGVVGIWPRYSLLDGTMTSQPEYSFWFHGSGEAVENRGVSPDIDQDISPSHYYRQEDPQILRGVQCILEKLGEKG